MPFDVGTVRLEFPLVREVVYLNTGTAGLCPLSVAEKLWESIRAFEVGGEVEWPEAVRRMEEGRERLAQFLHTDPSRLAFTRNATDGVNLVVEGIAWRPGDEVLLSAEEHPAMLFPWTYLAQRKGVRLRRFPVGMTPQETLETVQQMATEATRLVATSHVSSVTGKRIPVAEIGRWCREAGILTLVDGAQAVGQIPVALETLPVDYYVGNVHKWLHGPKGVGFLAVSPDALEPLEPTWVGAGSGSYSPEKGFRPRSDARCFEYGTRDFGRYGALPALFDWYQRLGWEEIWRWMQYLTRYLRTRLGELPAVRSHTPLLFEYSSAMTTVSVEGVGGQRLVDRLWELHAIRLRYVPEVDGIRISTTLFNTRAEVDRLVEALAQECRAK
ncbi:MAG: aminotransferase class V [Candidatus Poribacteria bacterium]|nr:MAG: aminotransferase class V [Candidatus Poribacteria bacterium]